MMTAHRMMTAPSMMTAHCMMTAHLHRPIHPCIVVMTLAVIMRRLPDTVVITGGLWALFLQPVR